MPVSERYNPQINLISRILIALLLILISFRPPDLAFSIGIDSPLRWVFNYLFETGLGQGIHIIFPHGPLVFFSYPMHANLLVAYIVTGLLQFGMIFGLFELCRTYNKKDALLPILLSVVLLNLLGFLLLILVNIIILYLNYFNNEKNYYKYLGLILTVFACYVKAYVATISVAISVSFLILEYSRNKNWISLARDSVLFFVTLYLTWFIMYQTLEGFFHYFIGMLNLASDNSAAAAYYPDNNWMLIIIFLLCIIPIPFIQRNREGRYFGLLLTLSIFLAWKHGMAREEIYHVRNFFIYVFMLMALFLVFNKKNILLNFILICIGLSTFYLNISRLPSFFPSHTEFFAINNFFEFRGNFTEIQKSADSETKRNLASNRLPENLLKEIGNSLVDVYPWDYSIIPANELNWTPRPVIHSYASYTPWLDKQNADHFSSENAPLFIVWDLNKTTRDLNGGSAESIDNRYLLNDEPKTMLSMISNYHGYYKDNSFLVLKKREQSIPVKINPEGSGISQWDEWIGLPEIKGDLLRAKTKIRNNLPGKIKSFLYKDESSHVYLKLSDGNILKYRIVPKNARDGIWLNPFLFDPVSGNWGPSVDSIMFRSSNMRFHKKKIKIEWELTDFEDDSDSSIYSFFQMDSVFEESNLMSDKLSYGGLNKNWQNLKSLRFLPDSRHEAFSYKIEPEEYSPTFTMPLDSLWPASIHIRSSLWAKAEKDKLPYVISIETKDEILEYHSINLREQNIDNSSRNHIFNALECDLSVHPQKTLLKVYLFNATSKDILIDNFTVSISTTD